MNVVIVTSTARHAVAASAVQRCARRATAHSPRIMPPRLGSRAERLLISPPVNTVAAALISQNSSAGLSG